MAAALVLVPTVAAMVSALRTPWAPTNDWALLELQVRAVGTADTPLLGAWSRFAWDHPGPWPFYLLALPYRLVPSEHGLLFAAAALNFVSIAACAAVALRRPRAQALVVLLGLAALQKGLGIAGLLDPWNPIQPILPFALYCLVCIELAVAPRGWMVPVAAAAGSFAIQAHVGFSQPVVLVGVVAFALSRLQAADASGSRWRWCPRPWRSVVGSLRSTMRSWPRSLRSVMRSAVRSWPQAIRSAARSVWRLRLRWRAALPTAIVLVLAWAPAAIDQVVGSGNAGKLARWAAGDDLGRGMGDLTEGRLPAGRVAGAASWLLDPVGIWLGRDDHTVAFGFDLLGERPVRLLLWLPVALAGVLAVGAVAARRGDRRPILCAAGIATAGVVATVTDLATARGAPVLWPFRWVAVVVMLVWVSIGWAVIAAIGAWARTGRLAVVGARGRALLRGTAAGALVALAAALVAATLWRGSLGQRPADALSDPIMRLVPAIVEHASNEELVVANSEIMIDEVDLGLPVILDRAGIPWIEMDDPRADGRPRYLLTRAAALEGLVGWAVDSGGAEVLASSGSRRPGEAPGTEVVLIRIEPEPAR